VGLAGAPGALGDPMLPSPFRVVRVRRDTADTVTMDLTSLDGEPLAYRPGQFTMLMAFGVGEVPISISGDPGAPDLLTHTIRDVGGVSRALAAVEPGDVLGVRGPYGVGWEAPDGEGGDVVIVAGGIGLAPLRPAVLEVLAQRWLYRRVSVLVGARTPSDLLFGAELGEWRSSDVHVAVTVDQAAPGWRGRVGLVTELIPAAEVDPINTLALVCGPEVMMRHVADALLARDVPAARIRLSLERNMRCGIGLCGHCQLREHLICVDGPVMPADRVLPLMRMREL
jgi:NAD(P)H-flavin reductase